MFSVHALLVGVTLGSSVNFITEQAEHGALNMDSDPYFAMDRGQPTSQSLSVSSVKWESHHSYAMSLWTANKKTYVKLPASRGCSINNRGWHFGRAF